jgi:hypothetical protein
VGHLVVDGETTQGYATASGAGAVSDIYDQVVVLDLATLPEADNAAPKTTVKLQHPETGGSLTGEDDIALGAGDGRGAARLYVVARPDKTGGRKHLVTFEKLTPKRVLDVEDTTIQPLFHGATQQLLLSMEDGYRIQVVDPTGAKTIVDRHPLQISPVALAGDARSGQVYALNFLSNTISAIPAGEIKTDAAFLKDLETYRDSVLTAFMRLLGGLSQYLKDCLCHHLLVNCPDCAKEDRIYLGVAEVRGKEIHNVCNFSGRRYVKSFPTVDYWMSILPVLPLLKWSVERFCCAVLPDLAAKFVKPAPPEALTHRVQSRTARKAVQTYQRADIKGEVRAQKKTINTSGLLFKDAVAARFESGSLQQPGLRKSLILGGELNATRKDLEAEGVVVEKVEPYDPALGAKNLIEFGKAPTRVAPGTRISLYEADGKVMYYRVIEPVEAAGVSESVKREIEDLEKRKAVLEDLSGVEAELDGLDARRADIMDLAALSDELGGLGKEKEAVRKELAAAREEIAALKAERAGLAELAPIKTELDRLTAARKEAADGLADLEKRRAVVTEELTKLQAGMEALSKMHREISSEIARDRPVREVTGITAEMDAHLRELGIRTVGELAAADPAAIGVRGAPITATQARGLNNLAKRRNTVQ